MNEDMPMRDEMPMRGTRPEPEMETEEKPSVFLTKESLGGKECKPGDTLTLKVVDTDAETGDVEAVLEGYSHKGGGSKDEGYEAEFDRAMPPEESE